MGQKLKLVTPDPQAPEPVEPECIYRVANVYVHKATGRKIEEREAVVGTCARFGGDLQVNLITNAGGMQYVGKWEHDGPTAAEAFADLNGRWDEHKARVEREAKVAITRHNLMAGVNQNAVNRLNGHGL